MSFLAGVGRGMMERDGGAPTHPHCSISSWQGGTKSASAISHPLPSGVGTKRAEGTQTLRQGGTCSELRNHTTFTATAKVLGKSEAQSEAQREAQEAAKEQRRKELKKDRWRKEALSILACSGPAGAVLCSHLIQLQPWLGEQSIMLRRHGRLKSLEGQKPDAELQVTCAEGGRRGSAQAAVMA